MKYEVRVKAPVLYRSDNTDDIYRKYANFTYLYEVRDEDGVLIDWKNIRPKPKF